MAVLPVIGPAVVSIIDKMLTPSGSAASVLMVTARNGQFSGSGCAVTTNVNSQLSDVQLELLVIGKRPDNIVLHNNNKTALVDLSESSTPPPRRRRSSSCRSAHSLLSGSLPASHKDQVGAGPFNGEKCPIILMQLLLSNDEVTRGMK